MKTVFDPTTRTNAEDLEHQIEIVADSPVTAGLLGATSDMLAVLNEDLQVLSLNEALLEFVGVEDPLEMLGLRPGEALDCRHAQAAPDGCGSGDPCRSCGTAIALAAMLATNRPAERDCLLTVDRDGSMHDFVMRVRAHPLRIDEQRFILLFLQDITRDRRRAVIERSFRHDLSNILSSLIGTCEMIEEYGADPDLIRRVLKTTNRLAEELAVQKLLALEDDSEFPVRTAEFDGHRMLVELDALFAHHPAARGRVLRFPANYPYILFRSDFGLCLRILTNMVVNALEATDEGGMIEIGLERNDDAGVFAVWNSKPIPAEHEPRIFQRNFSTKRGPGRGIGTFSMKLFGESILGGEVDFASPVRGGTEFRFRLPALR